MGAMLRAIASVFLASTCALAAPAPELTTVAERSGDERTGRYDEVVSLCADFERAFPNRARCTKFGVTPEGRPLLTLVVSEDKVLDPETAHKKGRPVIVLQGGIHAGEIDGKDAGFRVLRDALRGKVAQGALGAVTVVFIPVINVDGHERFGASNRPNQRGPEEMGWRTTAQNLNLNRDYVKAEAPEMHALLTLLGTWDPVLYVDLHVTDGAKFRHDVSITTEPAEQPNHPLAPLAKKLRHDVATALTASGHTPVEFYPSFVEDDDPNSGFAVGAAPPRFSTVYWATRNRLGLLVETHSWHTYRERVKATYDTLVAILELGKADGRTWRQREKAEDDAARTLGGQNVAVAFAAGEAKTTIDFLGYAWRREASEISGAVRIIYDETKPEVWHIPLVTEVKPSVTVRVPKAGYIVPAAHAEWVGEKLKLHGIEFTHVTAARTGVAVEVFHLDELKLAARSFEGRQMAEIKGRWVADKRDVVAGSLFVPIAQSAARLVIHVLEPEAPDSLVSWGYFNEAFEQKEYMEAYVAEELAEGMLAKDPKLREEFLKKLATDSAFAADPRQRRDFFIKRSPYLDTHKDEVPILRTDSF
jgi:zinc carboxypeptidase